MWLKLSKAEEEKEAGVGSGGGSEFEFPLLLRGCRMCYRRGRGGPIRRSSAKASKDPTSMAAASLFNDPVKPAIDPVDPVLNPIDPVRNPVDSVLNPIDPADSESHREMFRTPSMEPIVPVRRRLSQNDANCPSTTPIIPARREKTFQYRASLVH